MSGWSLGTHLPCPSHYSVNIGVHVFNTVTRQDLHNVLPADNMTQGVANAAAVWLNRCYLEVCTWGPDEA